MNRNAFGMPGGMPPVGAPIIGGQQRPPQSASIEAKMIAKDKVQEALYNAASVLSAGRSQVLHALSMLSDVRLACSQTVDNSATMEGPVLINGIHLSKEQFAEKFRLAQASEVDAVDATIELLRAAVEAMDERLIVSIAKAE